MDKKKLLRRTFFSIWIFLIAFFGFLLVCNIVVLIKSTVNPDSPPKIFGMLPMAVKSGSMSGDREGHIEMDDLIFVFNVKTDALGEGDVIAYQRQGEPIVTHRIVSIEQGEDGASKFITKGDANNVCDDPVDESELVGIYKGRIPKLGRAVLFLQTPLGIVLGVGVPILLFCGFEFLFCRRKKNAETSDEKAEKTENIGAKRFEK